MTNLPAVPERLTPSPLFQGAQMVAALADYRDLQKALDKAMPEQVINLDGKPFRRKGYWRAIAVAFNLTVELVQERRDVLGKLDDDTDNYVYAVTYRAATLNGRFTVGDGTCAASEKQRGRMRATEHNVRSHSHTRAYNRAVSNLVGFGEVSAEEITSHDDEKPTENPFVPPPRPEPVPSRPDPTPPVLSASEFARTTEGATRVMAVDRRTSKATGKVFHVVKFEDGREGTTFDDGVVGLAETSRQAGALIIPALETKGRYTNLVWLKPVTEDPAWSARQEPESEDVPF